MEADDKVGYVNRKIAWKRGLKIYWGIVREKSIVWWFVKILFWASGAALGFGISIWLKWEDVVSIGLLIVFGTEVAALGFPIIRDYIQLKVTSKNLKSEAVKEARKFWVGTIIWKATALLSFILGIGVAFYVYIGLRWSVMLTLVVLICSQFVAREVFLFVLLFLACAKHWEHIKRPTFP